MKEKEYLDRMLDLLVDMSQHCINKDKPIEDKCKCVDCDLSWNFSICNNGCFLVNILDNNDFIGDLTCACVYNDVDYEDRVNKVMEILFPEYE